jgi:hypothetical protein
MRSVLRKYIKRIGLHVLAHLLERGPIERRATISVVDVLPYEHVARRRDLAFELQHLTVDRALFLLNFRAHTRIQTQPFSYLLKRFHNFGQLSNRNQRWTRIRGESQVRGSMQVLGAREDRSSTPCLCLRKRHVCAGLRRFAGQRRAGFTQTFLWTPVPSWPRGRGGPLDASAKIKIQKNQNRTICKIAERKTLENFCHKIVFREFELEIVRRKSVLLF